MPVIESAVLTGRAVMRPVANVPLPARFVMVHQAGLVDLMEVMRYRNPGDKDKILWITGGTTPDNPAGWAMWLDQGHPWATFNPEDIVFNVDISQYIRGRGQAVP